jgi:hypothetical protein
MCQLHENDGKDTTTARRSSLRAASSSARIFPIDYFTGEATVQQGPSSQHGPSGQQDAFAFFAAVKSQHGPSGQQIPSEQHDAFVVVLEGAAQHGPSGQQGPSGQHDVFAVVLVSPVTTASCDSV